MQRFLDILERGHPLYGLDASCGAWSAGQGLNNEADEPGDDASSVAEPGDDLELHAMPAEDTTEAWLLDGHLAARVPDAEGRIHGLEYSVPRDQPDPDRLRMTIRGRGSWSAAPGVIIPSPGIDGYAIIGSGSYCSVGVEVRPDPGNRDAVLVGDEAWYFTREACQRSRSTAALAQRTCSDMKKAPTQP